MGEDVDFPQGSGCIAIGHHSTSWGRWVVIGDHCSPESCGEDALRLPTGPDGGLVVGHTVLGQECNLQDILMPHLARAFGVPDAPPVV